MPLCSDLLYFDLKIYLKMANGMHVLAMQNAMHEVSWEWNKREWQLPAFVTIQFQQRFPRLILRFYLGGFSLALLRSLPRRSDKKLYTKNNFFFFSEIWVWYEASRANMGAMQEKKFQSEHYQQIFGFCLNVKNQNWVVKVNCFYLQLNLGYKW